MSLFSGAGGMDLGVEDAGGDIRVMVEPNPDRVPTLRDNRRFYKSVTVIPRPLERALFEPLRSAGAPRKKLDRMLDTIDSFYEGGKKACLLEDVLFVCVNLHDRQTPSRGTTSWPSDSE